MKVLTLIKAKSNVFLWYVQCCSCTRKPKYWRLGRRHLGFSLTLWRHNVKLTLCFRQQSQVIFKKSRLTVWRHNVKLNPRWRRPSRRYFGFRSSRAAMQHCTYQRKTLVFALIKISPFICKREILGCSSPLNSARWQVHIQYFGFKPTGGGGKQKNGEVIRTTNCCNL